MSQLTHKGYSRIYIEDMEKAKDVESIIKEMDDFEYSYLPDKMIAPFNVYPRTVYTGKFSDMNMNQLTAKCWEAGIKIWV